MTPKEKPEIKAWKYDKQAKTDIKHGFWNEDQKFALCGRGPNWKGGAVWSNDKEGLSKRKKCKSCIRIIRGYKLHSYLLEAQSQTGSP